MWQGVRLAALARNQTRADLHTALGAERQHAETVRAQLDDAISEASLGDTRHPVSRAPRGNL